MYRRLAHGLFFTCLLLISAALLGCGTNTDDLILATTTSTQDSGLLDVLVPMFEEERGYGVKVIAVGSGQALRMGEEGEADVILAHAPEAERRFMEEGHGVGRRPVMRNDFVVVGPAGDPAGIADAATAAEALGRIADEGALFVSRGDRSGTHERELALWQAAGREAGQGEYIETGQGMALTLLVTSEKRGYVLTDRGTYLVLRHRVDLEVLFEGGDELVNEYSVIVVDPEKHRRINEEGARAFAEFLASERAREVIAGFGIEEYGERLFEPAAE